MYFIYYLYLYFTQIAGNDSNTKLKDYLEDELNKICLLEANIESLPLDAALEMYQIMQSELIPNQYSDEQLQEYYEYEQANENMYSEVMTVVCPMCQKSSLIQTNKQIVKCNECLFAMKTNLSLGELALKLNNALDQHACSNQVR